MVPVAAGEPVPLRRKFDRRPTFQALCYGGMTSNHSTPAAFRLISPSELTGMPAFFRFPNRTSPRGGDRRDLGWDFHPRRWACLRCHRTRRRAVRRAPGMRVLCRIGWNRRNGGQQREPHRSVAGKRSNARARFFPTLARRSLSGRHSSSANATRILRRLIDRQQAVGHGTVEPSDGRLYRTDRRRSGQGAEPGGGADRQLWRAKSGKYPKPSMLSEKMWDSTPLIRVTRSTLPRLPALLHSATLSSGMDVHWGFKGDYFLTTIGSNAASDLLSAHRWQRG